MTVPATLVLGSVPRVVVPVARCLARHGIPVVNAVFGREAPRFRSRAIGNFERLPGPDDPGCLDAFLAAIARHRIDYVIPCNDSSLRFLVRHYDRIAEAARISSPPADVIHRVLDKPWTIAAAERCGVPVPRQLPEHTPLAHVAAQLAFPVIAKPTGRASSSFKIRYFDTPADLEAAVRADSRFLDHNLIQEYCPGHGVGVEILMHGGTPRIVIQHRRIREYPRPGGVSVVAESQDPEPRLADMSVRLLRELEWNGVAMVEFRYDSSTGRIALMEVNGRYWGSVGLSFACGLEMPYLQWALDHGLNPDITGAYVRPGLRARWTAGVFQNIVDAATAPDRRFGHRCRDIAADLSDLSPAVRDMLFRFSDPIPALQDLAYELPPKLKAAVKAVVRGALGPELLDSVRLARRRGFTTARMLRRRRAAQSNGRPSLQPGPQSVLFVCHGNIMRSAFAERLLAREIADGVPGTVASTGMFAKDGRPALPRAVQAAREVAGIDLSQHAATRITAEHVANATLICVMDRLNEEEILARFPHADSKVVLLGQFSPSASLTDFVIPDPYEQGEEDLTRCFRSIQECVAELAGMLRSSGAAAPAVAASNFAAGPK